MHFETAACAGYSQSICRRVDGLREPFLPSRSAALLFSSGGADSYRFVANDRYVNEDDFTSRAAVRWDPVVWGPGETLEWVIAAEPGWTSAWEYRGETGPALFETPEEALPIVARGLAAWEVLETADIRWTVTGVEQVEGFVRDGRNTVTVQSTGPTGQAKPWMRLVNGEWKMEECDVRVSPLAMQRILAGKVKDLIILPHEFGHCLPLHHSAAFGDAASIFRAFPDSRGAPTDHGPRPSSVLRTYAR